jgi:Flp pilus assembly pilin Flp
MDLEAGSVAPILLRQTITSMLRPFSRSVSALGRHNAGQDLIEYALLIALIATAVLCGMSGFGVKVPGFYETTAAAMPGQEAPGGSPEDPPGNPGNDKPVGGAGENPSGKGK